MNSLRIDFYRKQMQGAFGVMISRLGASGEEAAAAVEKRGASTPGRLLSPVEKA